MAVINKTLSEAREQYLARQRQGRENVYKQDRDITGRMLQSVGDMQLRHLTPDHLEGYFHGKVDARTEKVCAGLQSRVAPVTFNGYRSRLNQFFKYCRAHNWLKIDPLLNVTRLRYIAPKKVWLSMGEMSALVASATNTRDAAFLVMGLTTVLRASELQAVLVSDVDLDAGTCQVTIHKGYERDSMPISAELDAILRQWLTEYTRAVGPLAPDFFLFPANSGPRFQWVAQPVGPMKRVQRPGVWLPEKRIGHPGKIVKDAASRIGIRPDRCGVHLLRRSGARLYHEGSEDIRETQALLHHKSLVTTETYLGLDPQREARDARLRGRFFFQVPAESQGNVMPLRSEDGA